jgi:hypothetical protein
MQVLIWQMDVEGAPKRCVVLRVGRTMTSIRFDLLESGGLRGLWAIERRECRRQPIGGRSTSLASSLRG